MAFVLAAFDNPQKTAETLQSLADSPFANLLQSRYRPFLQLYSISTETVEGLQITFPSFKVRRTTRLLDNTEGGVRGALLGIVSGVALVNLVGFGLMLLDNGRSTLAEGSGVGLGTAGSLVLLFLGFFGAFFGGLVGFLAGRRWWGLPMGLARRYEQRLSQGEIVLAVNRWRLWRDGPRRLSLVAKSRHRENLSLERFYFWLGEHGANLTSRGSGSVAPLKVSESYDRRPSPSSSAFTDNSNQPDERDSRFG